MAQIIANAQELRWSGLTIPSSGLYIYLTDLSAQNDFATASVQYDAINFSNYQYSAQVCNSQLNKGSYAIFPVVWIMPGDESGSVVVYLVGRDGLLPLNYNACYYGVNYNQPQAFEYLGNTQAKESAIYGMGIYTPFLPQTTKLATPTGLNATNITSSGATVRWTGDENATSYKVEYRRQGDTTWNE